MVPLANHRCVDSDKSFSAVATARDRRPVLCHGRQLAPRLVPVELRTGAALRAAASTTARTSERRCRRRQQRPSDASSPVPAHCDHRAHPSNRIRPPSCRSDRDRVPPSAFPDNPTTTATTDVDGDVGMTPEPLDRAPLRRLTTMTNPSLPAPTDTETAANAGEDPIPACPRDSGSGQ
ncbi:hypothetical protein MHU86_22236 [Fragilaria crotonensis]|nr:hypothetical protein MHU86_22236 [Fragilaria crotonensis]